MGGLLLLFVMLVSHLSCFASQMLAAADEQALARALVPVIAQQMRGRSSVGKQQQLRASGSASNTYAAVGMAARAAGTLVHAAREHLTRRVQEVTGLAADINGEEEAAAAAHVAQLPAVLAGNPAGQEAQQLSGTAAQGRADELSADELAHIEREVAQAAGGAVQGAQGDQPGPEVKVAPAAQLAWTQGVVRWGLRQVPLLRHSRAWSCF
jgi:hypothetical protein